MFILFTMLLAITLQAMQLFASEEIYALAPATFPRVLTRLINNGNQQLQVQNTEMPANETATYGPEYRIFENEAVFLPQHLTSENLKKLKKVMPNLARVTILDNGIDQASHELIREHFPDVMIWATRITVFSLTQELIEESKLLKIALIAELTDTFTVIEVHMPTISLDEVKLLRAFLPYTPLFLVSENKRIAL